MHNLSLIFDEIANGKFFNKLSFIATVFNDVLNVVRNIYTITEAIGYATGGAVYGFDDMTDAIYKGSDHAKSLNNQINQLKTSSEQLADAMKSLRDMDKIEFAPLTVDWSDLPDYEAYNKEIFSMIETRGKTSFEKLKIYQDRAAEAFNEYSAASISDNEALEEKARLFKVYLSYLDKADAEQKKNRHRKY